MFTTRDILENIERFATTLLASVERCSRCWTHCGGAMAGLEHGSTLASSVVAGEEDVARWGGGWS
ncbi:MAG: hypothetical protein GX575_30225 [Candidatus Anammoximicrobium sp.]|nr:hypothetical protein [Candidatus Anammoximicrobium sp.]